MELTSEGIYVFLFGVPGVSGKWAHTGQSVKGDCSAVYSAVEDCICRFIATT